MRPSSTTRIPIPAALVALVALVATGAGRAAAPIEVGTVDWRRDFDAALDESARTGVPVFAFFQEVPGCAGCRTFGAEVMSHPPLVAAIQEAFVPVLVFNNKGGRDAEILEAYGEPAWNYQVVRFLDGDGRDLIPRKDRVWTRGPLARRMIAALEAAGRPVPRYLEAVAYESDEDALATVAFAQACFWTGEARLGRVPGVVTTEAGWIDGREVTRVRYRPDVVSLDTLIARAVEAGVGDRVYVASSAERRRLRASAGAPEVGALDARYRPAGDPDQKRQIRGSLLDDPGLTPMQRTKVNAFAPVDLEAAVQWLTPAQRDAFGRSWANGRHRD